MPETTSGLRSILSLSLPYNLWQRAVGARRAYSMFLDRADIRPGQRVLDLGCGTCEILRFLPAVTYVGIDQNEAYIETARRTYGDRGTFLCQSAGSLPAEGLGEFDRALAIGVLHHLDDDEARHLFQVASTSLKNDGQLVTLDPCYTDHQGRLERLVFALDRGQAIRTQQGYTQLAIPSFPGTECFVHHDMLRIPFTHLVMSCRATSVEPVAHASGT